MNFALIDLGSNTFQLYLIKNNQWQAKRSEAPKLSKENINKGVIAPEAMQRAIKTLKSFKDYAYSEGIFELVAVGTSALRNATNANEFITAVKQQLQIDIEIIGGVREAELIYKGVKQAVNIDSNTLIMDIGGGSVEFILANSKRALWKNSFEVGGLRLLEKFITTDPISAAQISQMFDYFREIFLPLTNAIHQYQPQVLIGASGAFETIHEIYHHEKYGHGSDLEQPAFEMSLSDFYRQYEKLLPLNNAQRMKIEGMLEIRAEMIVAGSILIRFVLEAYTINRLKISRYALIDGLLSEKIYV